MGKFDEEFIWQVEGSPEPLKLRIMYVNNDYNYIEYTVLTSHRGTVIGPTFQFNVPEINFGTISYG